MVKRREKWQCRITNGNQGRGWAINRYRCRNNNENSMRMSYRYWVPIGRFGVKCHTGNQIFRTSVFHPFGSFSSTRLLLSSLLHHHLCHVHSTGTAKEERQQQQSGFNTHCRLSLSYSRIPRRGRFTRVPNQ